MAINFPNSPTDGQLFIDSATSNQYVYDSANTKWRSYTTLYTGVVLSVSIDYGYITDSITGSATIDYGSIA